MYRTTSMYPGEDEEFLYYDTNVIRCNNKLNIVKSKYIML